MSSDVGWRIRDKLRPMPSMVQYSFMSMEARRLVRTDSPGQPPRLSHSSRTMTFDCCYFECCFVAWKKGLSLKFACFLTIKRVFFLTFYVFRSCFRMLSVIIVSDFFCNQTKTKKSPSWWWCIQTTLKAKTKSPSCLSNILFFAVGPEAMNGKQWKWKPDTKSKPKRGQASPSQI